jgi:hypothetical protein
MQPPALNLSVWLSDLLECRDNPDRLDFDGLEDALDELRERAHCERAQLEHQSQNQELDPHLWDMLSQLELVAEELDLFLETELFYHLECALQASKSMLEQKELLVQAIQVETPSELNANSGLY